MQHKRGLSLKKSIFFLIFSMSLVFIMILTLFNMLVEDNRIVYSKGGISFPEESELYDGYSGKPVNEYVMVEYQKEEIESLYNNRQLTEAWVGLETEAQESDDNATGDISGEEKGLEVSAILDGKYSYSKLESFDYLIKNLYIVDSSTKAVSSLFNIKDLTGIDLTMPVNKKKPQILIYHTHGSETYSDSRKGEVEDTVIGMGKLLAESLRKEGYNVIHDTTAYDRKDGKDNRNYAYSTARPQIEKLLEENPAIEMIIDLHRDSGAKRVATVNGRKCAQIMLFNGLSRDSKGPIDYLENRNIKTNLAFSLMTKLYGDYMYPELFKKIYLKNYRYNMHLCGKYMLIELGTEKNTVKEAKNSIEPLAEVLSAVIRH